MHALYACASVDAYGFFLDPRLDGPAPNRRRAPLLDGEPPVPYHCMLGLGIGLGLVVGLGSGLGLGLGLRLGLGLGLGLTSRHPNLEPLAICTSTAPVLASCSVRLGGCHRRPQRAGPVEAVDVCVAQLPARGEAAAAHGG